MRFPQRAAALAACLSLSAVATAEDAGGPPIVPATRSEMKQVLEHSKQSQPRLPLPPPSADEQGEAARNGGWGLVNNARMRRLYLPPELDSGFTRAPDPAMTLDHAFKTMFFWIVSRANNCTYCMGHQESKLSASGVEEDRIAALDGDWSEFDDAQRAAFAFTRKLTYQPHAIDDADLDRLRPYYKEDQILEIIVTVANNNAMNRWTGSLAIPQEEHRVYLTPTTAKYRALVSQVAPLSAARSAEAPSCARLADRPPLESRAEVESALAACRARMPRIPPLTEAEARAVLSDDATEGPLPQWVRLLARFPVAGKARIVGLRNAETVGRLSPRLKAQIAWIAARHDRAWYCARCRHTTPPGSGAFERRHFRPERPLDDRLAGRARGVRLHPQADGRSGPDRGCRRGGTAALLCRCRGRRTDPSRHPRRLFRSAHRGLRLAARRRHGSGKSFPNTLTENDRERRGSVLDEPFPRECGRETDFPKGPGSARSPPRPFRVPSAATVSSSPRDVFNYPAQEVFFTFLLDSLSRTGHLNNASLIVWP